MEKEGKKSYPDQIWPTDAAVPAPPKKEGQTPKTLAVPVLRRLPNAAGSLTHLALAFCLNVYKNVDNHSYPLPFEETL